MNQLHDEVDLLAAAESQSGLESVGDGDGEEFLFTVLGERTSSEKSEAGLESFSDSFKEFGKQFFEQVQGRLRELLCGTSEEGKSIREQVSNAFGLGKQAVVGTLAVGIATALGVSAAVAAALAALIVFLFFQPTLTALCTVWKPEAAPATTPAS